MRKGVGAVKADCHIHAVLDGIDWKASLRRGIDEPLLRSWLQRYQGLGYTYLRDGGDRWGVGARARDLAPDYGITYRTPLAPLCKAGHYGSFIGTGWENLTDYSRLVAQHRENGADFIKIMISGLMDFDRFGRLTEEGLPAREIRELVHIAHEEGMAVMAHCNGPETAIPAAEAGVDSVEHGAYYNKETLWALRESGTVWVPTVSTVGNLLGKGRFHEDAVARILESLLENIRQFRALGGIIAPGSDAGAWAVPHGCDTEYDWLQKAGLTQEDLDRGIGAIQSRF